MFSLLKRLATVPTLLTALAECGPLALFFLLKVPDRLARTMGYTGEQSMFALDVHPSSPEATYELLTDYGETGRRATIVLHLLFDMIYPVSYTLFFSSSFTLLGPSTRTVPRLWRRAAVLPWLVGCSDLLENTGIITMARSYPSQRRLLARLTSHAAGPAATGKSSKFRRPARPIRHGRSFAERRGPAPAGVAGPRRRRRPGRRAEPPL